MTSGFTGRGGEAKHSDMGEKGVPESHQHKICSETIQKERLYWDKRQQHRPNIGQQPWFILISELQRKENLLAKEERRPSEGGAKN